MRNYIEVAVIVFVLWCGTSVLTSAIKSENGNCGKTYPIDYVIYANLFCEVQSKDQ